ncbi:hypothetical protein PRZ48_001939 [Zasmidium cellare]|uniref:Uncharacterized protein n=1 Tax=Zasmidium cellare TaxID=395010 RepID=A0ABR0F2M4_ZASCE|nr:hypothetical protein PRZ48_001939 [Zasmidium cellare]
MAGIPEIDLSLLTHSSVSIPSSLDSRSTAVPIKQSAQSSDLREDDNEFQTAIASTSNNNLWRPSYKRIGPVLGLMALGFIMLAIPASALVLALSNGKPVEQWRVQPSVFISVLTGVGNKALSFASIQGAIITWWVKALRGTTLQDLHYDWPVGNGSFVLFRKSHITLLAVVSICASVIFLDGILLQSATYTVEHNLQRPVTLRATLSLEIPTNYTATGALLNPDNPYLNADFSSGIEPVRRQWTDGLAIPSPLQGCEGVCTAKVRAAALAPMACRQESSSWLNFTEIKDMKDMSTLPAGCKQRLNSTHCQVFELQVFPSAAHGSWERVDISYGRFMPIGDVNQGQCAGNLTYTMCSFRSAIAEYNVTTYNNTSVTIVSATPRILDVANNTARDPYPLNEQINTTIGGIALPGSKDFYSTIGIWSPGTEFQYTDNINRIQSRFMSNANDLFSKKACAPIFEDPVPEVLTVLNKFMFSTSVYAAKTMDEGDLLALIDPGLEINYDVQGLRIDAQPIFRTSWDGR